MAGRWFLVGLAVLTGCCFITANSWAGLVDSNLVTSPRQAWNGFEAEFSPEWEGETEVVETWQYNSLSMCVTDIDACIMAANWGRWGSEVALVGYDSYDPGHWETRPTVRKISSSSDSKVLNTAWLRHDGQEYRATKNEDSGAEMARYARLMSPQSQFLTQVFTQDGLPCLAWQTVEEQLLALSASIASRNASFGDDEFSADGRVSATAILNYAAKEATASSTGRSWLKAKYELDRDTDFSLDLDLEIRGQVDFSFTVTDVDSGEVAFCFDKFPKGISIGIGTQQEFVMDGTLEAGTYEFALNCLTDASVNSLGQWNLGGQAEFDLSLDLEEEYVQVWVPGDDCRTASDVVALLAKYFDLPRSSVASLDPDDMALLLAEYVDSTGTTVSSYNQLSSTCGKRTYGSSSLAMCIYQLSSTSFD